MKEYIDERCPCNLCIVQVNCTKYCQTFHYYRRLVIAEAEFFTLSCDSEYKLTIKNGERLMTLIERDAKIVFNRIDHPTKRLSDNYLEVKRNLNFLVKRFDIVIGNSMKANRGTAIRDQKGTVVKGISI